MEEIRIDCANPTPEEVELSQFHAHTLFRLNHTLPFTTEYEELLHLLFPDMGEGSRIVPPLKGVRFNEVKIGRNVVINSDCLMMAAGGIYIEDDVMIAANAQLISNNHDLDNRWIITCKPVRIGRRAWIGAGATILPGVTVGENAVVGAGSVVTKDVEPNTIVAGNPAKLIRRIEPTETEKE
ncbi:MAG: galactoside O-acetyltransferase [Bacteroidaceae bacterium]|nr:galactoside O-acetyltransferase [Bacteroidaceae bacterium]